MSSASCLHTARVQCLYYMLCLKRMVCNAHTICYAWNEWCAMLVICAMFEMNGVQCLYYVLPTLWYWGRYLHTFYSCPLSSRKIDYMLGLRAHFYDMIARKLLSCPNSSFPFSSSCRPPHRYPSFTRSFLVTVHLLADTALCMGEGCCGMSVSRNTGWGCLFVVVECGDGKWSPAGDCDRNTVGRE